MAGCDNGLASSHCHRYSYWAYKIPQTCTTHGVYARTRPSVGRRPGSAAAAAYVAPSDIPLPDLKVITWGGEMDTELELQLQRLKAIRSLNQ